jgi:flagellar hook-length control protein FliK
LQAQLQASANASAGGTNTQTTDDAGTTLTDGTTAQGAKDGDKADGTHHGKRLASADGKTANDALQAALAALNGTQGAVPAQATNAGNATTGAAGSNDDTDLSVSASKSDKNSASNTLLGDAKLKQGDKTDPTAVTTTSPTDTAARDAADALALTGMANTQDSLSSLKGTADAANAALAASQAAASASTATTATQGTNPATTAAAASTLGPEVGTSDWEEALGQKVVFLSNAHQQSAELTLNPKDLGPLQVVLQVADNHAHALFVSQHPQVREAVEAALPKLREAMEQNGIGLGSASVTDGFARQTGQQGQSSANGARNGSASGVASGGDDDGDSTAVANVAVRRTVGLVDTFA